MGHSHDAIDWDEKLRGLRQADLLRAPEHGALAETLLRPGDRSVIEVGAGAGGTAAAFAARLPDGSVTVVDSAPELLSAASEHVRSVAPNVAVHSVQADAASAELAAAGQADLVFASLTVHHLPDQLAGLRQLAGLARPGGRLAFVETGLPFRVLPWDVGVGDAGLEVRLLAAREEAFRTMRAEMDGSVRLPMGWTKALSEIGMSDVHSFSYLIERRAPVTGTALGWVVSRLEWLRDGARDRVSAEDMDAVEQLLDPDGRHYVGHRDDVYILGVDSVHVGTRAAT